jgi:hypothetical protein
VSELRRHRDVKLPVGQSLDEPALLWVGPLTIAVSVAAVLFILVVAVALLKPDSKFLSLTVETPVVDTVISSACAVLVFRALGRYSLEPVREFHGLAWKVLVVSFGPDILLATQHWFGGGWQIDDLPPTGRLTKTPRRGGVYHW